MFNIKFVGFKAEDKELKYDLIKRFEKGNDDLMDHPALDVTISVKLKA